MCVVAFSLTYFPRNISIVQPWLTTSIAYGAVRMLHVPIEVNGRKGQAMVGSGANRTIVSAKFAAASGISDMVNTRCRGVARGTGTMKISGSIPGIEITVGHIVLATSVTVMADDLSIDILLGLNTLGQYQACIDLKQDVLEFQGHVVDFLDEASENRYRENVESRDKQQEVKTLKPAISCDQLQHCTLHSLFLPWKFY